MDIVKPNKFNLSKKEVKEYGQQSKHLNSENRRLKYIVEILKDPNDVCECVIVLNSFSVSKKKKDQVISVVLSKLAKADVENQVVSNLG